VKTELSSNRERIVHD